MTDGIRELTYQQVANKISLAGLKAQNRDKIIGYNTIIDFY